MSPVTLLYQVRFSLLVGSAVLAVHSHFMPAKLPTTVLFRAMHWLRRLDAPSTQRAHARHDGFREGALVCGEIDRHFDTAGDPPQHL